MSNSLGSSTSNRLYKNSTDEEDELLILLREEYDENITLFDIQENIYHYDIDHPEEYLEFIYGILKFPDCVYKESEFMRKNMDKFVHKPPQKIIDLISLIRYIRS